MTRTALLALLVAMGTALLIHPGPARGEVDREVEQAIAQLGSEDPAQRRAAAERIAEIGLEARAALLKAVDSPDPAIAQAARSLLRTLPWHTPDDPPEVRQHLEMYAAASSDERRQIITHLSQLRSDSAAAALLRILSEEPSASLRWLVVRIAIERPDLITLTALGNLEEKPGNAPLLAAMGWGWRQSDRPRAERLIRRALELEAQSPSEDYDAIYGPWRWLMNRTLARGEPEAAAELCRLVATRHAALHPERDSWALRELFSLHARIGPLASFQQDLQRFALRLRSPVDLYLVAAGLRQHGDALLAGPIEQAAFLQSACAPSQRLQNAWLLMQLNWIAPAERELLALLSEPSLEAGVPEPLHEAYRASALTSLAYLAGLAGHDALAARRWEQAIPALREFRDARIPGQAIEGDATVHAREQMLWRRLRVARAAGDAREADELVDELARLGVADADVLHELIPELVARGREEDAQRLFEAAYQLFKVSLEQAPQEAEPMNNLAWLCARAGRRLDEALRLASRAVELEPDNAAYLDTLAEVHFARGEAARAVELEQQALRLRPGDPFMQRQLARFRAGAATRPAAQP